MSMHLLALLISLLTYQPQNKLHSAHSLTNPDDCVLTKIVYSSTSYDVPTYDSRGLITFVQSYSNGTQTGQYVHVFDSDGKIISQNLKGLNFRYVYEGKTLTKIQLLEPKSQSVLGEYGVTFDSSGRIGKLNVQNTAGMYRAYEGYSSTFTYDSQDNCTSVDLKDNQGRLMSRTVCSDFVPIRSFATKFKNHYISPFTSSVTENLQFPLPYRQPNTCPNHVEIFSGISRTGTFTDTMTKTTDYTYQRTANQSGMMTKRMYTTTGMSDGSGSTTYEYSGCQ